MIKIGNTEIGNIPGIDKVYLGTEMVFNENPLPSRLPTGYTEIEYIENQSTARLNTGISGVSSWTIKAQMITATGSTEILIGSSADAGCFFGVISSIGNKWGLGSQSGMYVTTSASVKTDISLQVVSTTSMSGTINGESFSRTGTRPSSANIWLFSHDSSSTYAFRGRIYGDVVCVQNGNETFHGVPCKDSNNIPGLYDLVGNTFIHSLSGVEFVAGPNV